MAYVIGITGGSASGKTLFLNQLIEKFEAGDVCLISQDNYYIDRDKQPIDVNGVQNFDLPDSIDSIAFVDDIKKIKSGQGFTRKEYTFNNPAITPKKLEFSPAPIVIVEGLFVMHFPEMKDLLDLKIFIDAKDHIRLKRRIIRDNTERGYDLDDVLYRFENHVMPTYDRYLEPLKSEADIIIPNNTHFNNALEVLSGFLHARLKL
ncbi:uridine-cytidine kinase [Fulvivirga sp.]|uniref:uridine kinase family protein n=1 Tax=Fulvivirga sp. TaxID=1931237 RepID=UPI0032EFB125